MGYDILTWKTVRDRFWSGHPLPNILFIEGNFDTEFVRVDEFSGSMTNSFGMASPPPNEWSKDIAYAAGSIPPSQILKVSVVSTPTQNGSENETVSQFAHLAELVRASGVEGVEFNLSCPNVAATEGDIYMDPKFTARIVEAARDRVGPSYPIFLKVGYLDDYGLLIESTLSSISGIVAINAIPGIVKFPDGSLAFSDRGKKAGICGAAIFRKGIAAVRQLALLREKYGDFLIVGVGGILKPSDAVEYLDSGADVIEIGTGAMYNPYLALEIKLALHQAIIKQTLTMKS